MGLELDCRLFLVFRTSWLLWSQTSLSKLVKTVLCHITEVFLCERALSFTVVRPCYEGSTKAWLVCSTGVNSQSDCVALEQLPVKSWHWAGFHSRLPPRGYQHCLCSGKDLGPDSGTGAKRSPAYPCTLHPSCRSLGLPTESVHRIQLVHLHLSLAI